MGALTIVFCVAAGAVGGAILGSLMGALDAKPGDDNPSGNSDIAMLGGGFFGMILGALGGGIVGGMISNKTALNDNLNNTDNVQIASEETEADLKNDSSSYYFAPQSFQFS